MEQAVAPLREMAQRQIREATASMMRIAFASIARPEVSHAVMHFPSERQRVLEAIRTAERPHA
jgi:hypothetical protein